jgi:hypothetical protein
MFEPVKKCNQRLDKLACMGDVVSLAAYGIKVLVEAWF